jgi:molybdenum cofactor biosynthesis protein A
MAMGMMGHKQQGILVDLFGRTHSYLRMSITEKCNLRCTYCMPSDGVTLTPRPMLMTLQERKQTLSLFSRMGVSKLRFTGGEPTISNQLVDLIKHAKNECGISSIGITTNGLMLGHSGNERMLDRLIDAGLTSINVSLDTLDEGKFGSITRRDGKNLYLVLKTLYNSLSKVGASSGLRSVKLNVVLMRGFNDAELGNFMELIKDYGSLDVRFIEMMPFDGNEWSRSKMMSYLEAIDEIERNQSRQYKLIRSTPANDPNTIFDRSDTTKWYRVFNMSSGTHYQGRVGFITSMSSHFCGSCNRLRITADGKLKVCLFGEEGLSLVDHIRRHDSNTNGSNNPDHTDMLIAAICAAIRRKKLALGGHGSPEGLASSLNRPMILIGG